MGGARYRAGRPLGCVRVYRGDRVSCLHDEFTQRRGAAVCCAMPWTSPERCDFYFPPGAPGELQIAISAGGLSPRSRSGCEKNWNNNSVPNGAVGGEARTDSARNCLSIPMPPEQRKR